MKSEMEIREEINALHRKCNTLLDGHDSDEEVVAILVRQGVEASYARMIIENVKASLHARNAARSLFISGAFISIEGVSMRILSYQFVERMNASYYFIFTGIILSGILLLIKAYATYQRSI